MPEVLDLGLVPFYWRTKASPNQTPRDIPVRLPFAFSHLPELDLVIQQRNPEVLACLNRVYNEESNVGYLQEGHALAESYGGEFIEFFDRAAALLLRPPATAADIGCGGIYLLQRVRQRGLRVKGIDPSPVTVAAGKRAGIDILADFYPSPSLTERFDVLFHYDVLEHVEDPVGFLRAHHVNLTEQGAVIFAVPDCTQHIRLGDASMMLHEHLNYFDEASLNHVVRAAGFNPVLLEPARHGGVLLCCAVPVTRGKTELAGTRGTAGNEKFTAFRERLQVALGNFERFARESSGGALGLYVPLRAFPYLGRLDGDQKLRFFDDDAGLHGRFFDGFDVPVENFSDLKACPPKHLAICSLAFGDRIAHKLEAALTTDVRMLRWADLFDDQRPNSRGASSSG